MFHAAFSNHIYRDKPLKGFPDYAFTLFSETTDPTMPTYFKYSTTINKIPYSIKTRLIVTPHFSYNDNFLPQFRLSKEWADALWKRSPECKNFLQTDPRITANEPEEGFNSYTFAPKDVRKIFADINKHYKNCEKELIESYYNAHQTMAQIMEDLYNDKVLTYQDPSPNQQGFLVRTEGGCQFCENKYWTFPAGCPYGKPEEKQPPVGFLIAVATEIAKTGKPEKKLKMVEA